MTKSFTKMKINKTLPFVLAICIGTNLQSNAQTIPNGGFESWTKKTLFENPDHYGTSNPEAYRSTGQANATKVAGVVGQYAIQMLTVGGGEKSRFGYFLNGNVSGGDNNTPPEFTGGQPYTGKPDSILFQAKYDIKTGDSALVILRFSKAGVTIGEVNFFFISGVQSSFKEIGFKIPTLALTPDTVFIGMVSSNPIGGNPVDGSMLVVDDIHFKGGTTGEAVVNGSFEDWSSLMLEEPDQWYTGNLNRIQFDSQIVASKSTDRKGGEYSLRLETFLDQGDSGTYSLGYVSTDNYDNNGNQPTGGLPCSVKPTKLTGYYKYIPNGLDTASIMVAFSKYNTNTHQRDYSWSFMKTLAASANYQSFTIDIDTNQFFTPDSAHISIYSSFVMNPKASTAKNGSVLFVDDLSFGNLIVNGVKSISDKGFEGLFPNPASDKVFVKLNVDKNTGMNFSILDMLGKEVYSNVWTDIPAGSYQVYVPLNTVSKGIYSYQLILGNETLSGKLVVAK